jgi:4-hydroxy-4-methyl-2-oxoglutarate aldolase
MYDYTHELLEQAKSLGSSTIYEASGLNNTALDRTIRTLWDGGIIAGPAYPVACAPGDNLAIHIALEKAPAGSILVITTDNSIAGYWGEVLTVAAQAAGVTGLVIDGGVRDIAAIRRRRFPVYCRGISVHGTHKKSFNSVGQPIKITGTPVQAGDLVTADDDGVVVLPQESVVEVIRNGQAREQKEAAMMRQLIDGSTTLELMNLTGFRDIC